MINDPKKAIKTLFDNFEVGGEKIPVAFLNYSGKKTTYVTYQQTDAGGVSSADDEIQNYNDFYDFDIYSKGNYEKIVEAIITNLKTIGFRWQPTRSSGDMFEDDTGYYHKTLSFSIERTING